jgi:hypothetical protein
VSSIAFHSATDTARVSGSERAHFGLFGTDLARRLLDCTIGVRDEEFHARLSTMVPPNHWWHREGGVRRDQAHGLITLHDPSGEGAHDFSRGGESPCRRSG